MTDVIPRNLQPNYQMEHLDKTVDLRTGRF
jgi:hypothetical protein